MELIRQWALTLCICATMTSILQGVLPEKGAFSGIKLVLTLYILITLLSPLKSFSISQIDLRVDTPEVAVLQQDTEQVILNRAQNQLSEKVKKALESEGVEAISVDLTLKLQQDGGATEALDTCREENGIQRRQGVKIRMLDEVILVHTEEMIR